MWWFTLWQVLAQTPEPMEQISGSEVLAYGTVIGVVITAMGALLKSYYENRQKYEVAIESERTKKLAIEAKLAEAVADAKEADLERVRIEHQEAIAELKAQHKAIIDRMEHIHESEIDAINNRLNECERKHEKTEEEARQNMLRIGRLEGTVETLLKRIERFEEEQAK